MLIECFYCEWCHSALSDDDLYNVTGEPICPTCHDSVDVAQGERCTVCNTWHHINRLPAICCVDPDELSGTNIDRAAVEQAGQERLF